MKKILFGFAALSMLAVSCNKEQTTEEVVDNSLEKGKVYYEIKVTIDPETRGAFSDMAFNFQAGDEIAVIVTELGTPSVETLSVTANDGTTVTFGASLDSEAVVGDYAYYPASIANASTPTIITWPTSFDATACGGAMVPMMAKIENNTAEFKHLGAMMKVALTNVPAGANLLEFKTSNNFTGTYNVNTSTWAISGNTLSGNVETVSIDGNDTYYIPIPAGSYADFQLAMKEDAYYHKQRTANLASAITPGRKEIVNLGTFNYDIDSIEEWYLVDDMTGWSMAANNLRMIKVSADVYEISNYVYYIKSSNPWYKFYSPDYDVTGVNAASTGTLAKDKTCKREADEIFTATLTKSGSDWVLSDTGYGSSWDRCYDVSSVTVYLKGEYNSWGTTDALTKIDYNNNMLWYKEGVVIPNNDKNEFKFYVKGSDWDWWIGGTSVNLADASPYAQAGGDDNMVFQLTPGTYNVYLDIKTLRFMFVKQ